MATAAAVVVMVVDVMGRLLVRRKLPEAGETAGEIPAASGSLKTATSSSPLLTCYIVELVSRPPTIHPGNGSLGRFFFFAQTNRFILSSNCTIFSSCSIFRGFGLTMAGGLGTSSRGNQSENSDFAEKSFSSWSWIARAVVTELAIADSVTGTKLSVASYPLESH